MYCARLTSSLFAICLSLGLPSGCAGRTIRGQPDEWYAPPASWDWQRQPVPDEQFRVVAAESRAAAEASLSTRPWVPISELPGLALDTEGLVVPEGGRVYLVRGVMLEGTDGTGRFSIEQADDGTTAVNWGCLGAGAARQVRRPLIVALPRPPRELVVAVSMAR